MGGHLKNSASDNQQTNLFSFSITSFYFFWRIFYIISNYFEFENIWFPESLKGLPEWVYISARQKSAPQAKNGIKKWSLDRDMHRLIKLRFQKNQITSSYGAWSSDVVVAWLRYKSAVHTEWEKRNKETSPEQRTRTVFYRNIVDK